MQVHGLTVASYGGAPSYGDKIVICWHAMYVVLMQLPTVLLSHLQRSTSAEDSLPLLLLSVPHCKR